MIRNEQEITPTTDLSFCLSSALQKQLHSLLCACFCALKTNKNPVSVVKVISCSFLNKISLRYWLILLVCCLTPLTAYSQSGQRLPDISLPDTDGQAQSLQQWQGKKVLVNFWATWCAPCRKEMPDLVSLQSELKDQGLQVIGIALDEISSVQSYLKESPVNYPILMAPETGGTLSDQLGNTMGVLPFSAFVGRDGVVEFTHIGLITKDMVKNWMQNHIGKSQSRETVWSTINQLINR